MKKKQIKQLTIKVDKWARGQKNGDAALLNEKGNMCCLGFLGKACGIPKEILEDKEMPYMLHKSYRELYPNSNMDKHHVYGFVYQELSEDNDNANTTDCTKKKILKQKFKKYFNIKLLFT